MGTIEDLRAAVDADDARLDRAVATFFPTASSLDIAFECIYPWAPGVVRLDREIGIARLGSAFHAAVQRVIDGVTPDAPTIDLPGLVLMYRMTPEESVTLTRMVAGWEEWWQGRGAASGVASEVAFAYNPQTDTARRIRSAGHRDYSDVRWGEFAGTADLVRLVDGVPTVCDWKCGQPRYVTKVDDNRQLRFLALCAAREHSRFTEATAEIAFVDEDGNVRLEGRDFDAFDLAAIAGEMAALAARLIDQDDQDKPEPREGPRPGPQCSDCPAVASCPKSQEALAQVEPQASVTTYRMVAEASAIESPAHATWLLHRHDAAEAALGFVKRALREYADAHGGIATGAGGTWKRRDYTVDDIAVTPEVKAYLDSELPGAVRFEVSKKGMKDAARALNLPLAPTERRIMEELRKMGVVTVSPRVKYSD